MLIVPLTDTLSQTFAIQLGGQNCQINVYQKSTGLFLDLNVNDALIIGGVLCLNAVKIVRDAYLGFTGDLEFIDTNTGENVDPFSPGLGTRFLLCYLEAVDLNAAV